MELLQEFISTYGITILYGLVIAIAGYCGTVAKKICERYLTDKTKKAIAKTCVEAIEQMYKDLHGEEKLQEALSAASDMLASRNIIISDLELRMLIESAVGEFNDVFNNHKETKEVK